jgi:hypothetical protein
MDRRFWGVAATASTPLLVLSGLLNAPATHAQSARAAGPVPVPSLPQFEAASVKPVAAVFTLSHKPKAPLRGILVIVLH